MRKLLIFTILFGIKSTILAQEQFNFKSDNYSGVNGLTLDPTHTLSTQYNWDINLLTLDAFVHTNYAYISDASLISIIAKRDLQETKPTLGITGESQSHVIDYYGNNKKKDAYVQADVMGPSVSYRLNYSNNVGLYTRARAVASGRNVDPGFNYYNFHEFNFGKLYDLKKSNIQGATWVEIGGNFSHVLRENKEMQWTVGANLRYLIGTDAAYAKSFKDVNVSSKQDTLSLSGADVEIGLVTGAEMYDKKTAGEYKLQRKGGGIGLDIGTSLVRKRYTTDILIDTDVTYKWKFNFSVLDLGYIRYKDAEVHRYITDNPIIVNFKSANNQPTVQKYFQDLSTQVYAGDSLKSKIKNHFVIGLPTALNLNFDYGLTAHWYVKANVIQRIPMFTNALKRSNVININGRYQKEWIGISGGITSYEYQNLYLGGSLRIGPLIIGSDNFIPIIVRQKEATQADLYVGIKINEFWRDFLNNRRS